MFRCSGSIWNFHDKLVKRLQLPEWHWWRNRNDRVIFFGLYHWKDYLRFLWHRGQKKVFWCGSDILALQKHWFWQSLIIAQEAKHYCENEVEQKALSDMLIDSEIRPMIFDDPNKFEVSYKWSEFPKYFATYRKGREQEYGVRDNLYIDFLEGLSEQEFNEKIKNYQGAIRFNKFDGFAETLAKSVLMGQWPISVIPYPYMISFSQGNFEKAWEKLKDKKQPNYEGREYWLKVFAESLKVIKEDWV